MNCAQPRNRERWGPDHPLARAMGLGTCPVGLATPLFDLPEIKQELGIVSERVAAMPLAVVHPIGSTPPTFRHPPRIVAWR
jgi:nitroreductase